MSVLVEAAGVEPASSEPVGALPCVYIELRLQIHTCRRRDVRYAGVFVICMRVRRRDCHGMLSQNEKSILL